MCWVGKDIKIIQRSVRREVVSEDWGKEVGYGGLLFIIVTSLPALFIDEECTQMFLQIGFSSVYSIFHFVLTHASVYILEALFLH